MGRHTLKCDFHETTENRLLTTVPMASEETLIERVRQRFPASRAVQLGIGDDAAVLAMGGKTDWVITTDQFLENVHFLRRLYPPKVVGYKALARATSDIAAMGARPRCFFLTLGLPAACSGKWFDDFLDGMKSAARRFGLALAGGDTTKFPEVVISLTVLGEVDRGRAILRSGARPGDLLCVSGTLGEAELGWRLVQKRWHTRKRWAKLLRKHFRPEPGLALGQPLAAGRFATAMIDTSDGLSTDLGHLCRASGVGAIVWAGKIPVVDVPRELRSVGLDPLKLALHGGEDYELLFTVPRRLVSRLPRKAGVSISIIGEMTREKEVVLVDAAGGKTPLKPMGWDPFR
jgi:thiamine-monophosphate kinase